MTILEKFYHATATHSYIFGADCGGTVRVYMVTLDIDGYGVIFNEKPTTAKRQMVIKYRSTRAKREWLEIHASKAFDLLTVEELKANCQERVNRYGETYTENCGDCLERLLAEYFGVPQNEKSNLKHTDGGDLVIDGIAYQVKYEKGGIAVSL